MSEVTGIETRKADHIRINLEENVRSGLTNGLERYRFIHRALPEINLDEISLQTRIFSHQLDAPILISSITGGTDKAASINRVLAEAAQFTGIALGVGSQRIALEQPELSSTFQIRRYAPNVLLFANLGAVQLNYSYTYEHCLRAVEMIEADGLILHLNALQEAVQPQGDTRFRGLVDAIAKVCSKLTVPVIVKEVGWGFSKQDVKLLLDTGIAAIDVAGAGGTSWTQVEKYRTEDELQVRLADDFIDWGIPTAEAILNVTETSPKMLVFASGGLRSGVEIAKCLALGAVVGGMAGPFLKTAVQSVDKTIELIQLIKRQIQVCMFASGAGMIHELDRSRLSKVN